ncbi:hypothetical protein [Companilactobacillus mishanensis]|uniref:Uncharacterized protein n=1 Tax=Companilactobacillus mishanensis TaxID=2486008 RepID=A0A5P0ZHD2_9LACO|nr:hypothetical protein [Companilactobacillus mishanensis]MQS52470.1 hypothetical protein [Companilactobacillus mishanensis]MQS89127.1 hypothetical protein [Companilactobacillus mishanensis]
MNPAQKRAVQYGQLINKTVEKIQENQDLLNPEFEILRKALDRDQVDKVDPIMYKRYKHDFEKGTADYKDLEAKLKKGKAPARLMGTHLSLVSAFSKYVEGCVMMSESIGEDQKIERQKFDDAEKIQDENMDKFSKLMQKLTQLAG